MSLERIRRSGVTYIARSKSCQRNVLSTKPKALRTSVRKLLKILCSQSDCGDAVWGQTYLAVFVCLLFIHSVRALRGRQSKHTRSKSTAFCLSIGS
jgi:hypothetical protein